MPEDVTPKKREQRKRKPNRKYSSSDDQSEELMDIDESLSPSKSKLLKSSFNNVFFENQGSIHKTSSTTDMSNISTMSRSAIKKQAEDLLESDLNIKPFHGYKDNEISHDEKKSNWYKECLSSEVESMNFSEFKESLSQVLVDKIVPISNEIKDNLLQQKKVIMKKLLVIFKM